VARKQKLKIALKIFCCIMLMAVQCFVFWFLSSSALFYFTPVNGDEHFVWWKIYIRDHSTLLTLPPPPPLSLSSINHVNPLVSTILDVGQ
jgi:hypothetical protein